MKLLCLFLAQRSRTKKNKKKKKTKKKTTRMSSPPWHHSGHLFNSEGLKLPLKHLPQDSASVLKNWNRHLDSSSYSKYIKTWWSPHTSDAFTPKVSTKQAEGDRSKLLVFKDESGDRVQGLLRSNTQGTDLNLTESLESTLAQPRSVNL